MTKTEILAAHPDYQITLHQLGEVPSEKIVVTFGGQPSDLSDRGFGTAFVLGLGMDTIYVSQRYKTQYQGLGVEAFSDSVSRHTQGRDVIAYGSSLGAYAALYFGGSVNARIIAAAPMLPAWPPLRDKTYADLEIKHVDLTQVPRSETDPVIIFDPMRTNDSRIVDEMVAPAYPDARVVKIPHGGHTVLVTLSRARILKPLILGLIERDEIIGFAMPGEGTAIYHRERGRHFMSRDRVIARRELVRSLEIEPTRPAFCTLVNLLIMNGELDEAQALIDHGKKSSNKEMTLVPSLVARAVGAGLTV